MKYEYHFQIEGPETSQLFTIPVGKASIGRQKGNDLQLDDPQISRQHAQLECTDTDCQIMDLGSSNGTRVNEAKLTPNVIVPLSQDDVVKIGPFTLILSQIQIEEKIPEPEVEQIKIEVVEEPQPKEGFEEEIEALTEEPGSPPPSEPPAPPGILEPRLPAETLLPPGLTIRSQRLMNYLPYIYHTDFLARFLGLLESIQRPIEWNIDNFDLYLDPGTSITSFLPWLANWFEITFDTTWNEEQRRTLLKEAHMIYARRGTRWALSRVLEIYTGGTPEISDSDEKGEPFIFSVKIPTLGKKIDKKIIEELIDAHKPAHTSYILEI